MPGFLQYDAKLTFQIVYNMEKRKFLFLYYMHYLHIKKLKFF